MKFILCLLSFVPFILCAQKIKVKGYDKFIRQQLIQTEALPVIRSDKANVSLAFTALSSQLYMQMSGSEMGTATIDAGDLVILTLSNGSDITLKSTGLQSFYANVNGSSYQHSYSLELSDIAALSRYEVVALRKYMFGDFIDFKIPAASAAKFKSLSSLFLKELAKTGAPKPAARIQPQDMRRHIGDSVVVCGTVFITRFFESFQNQASILDFQSSRSAPGARAIIWKEHRQKLGNLPRAFYTNKEVCISGVVYLYENIPYIQISNKEQLRVTSPLTTDEAYFFIGDNATVSGVIEKVYAYPGVEEMILQLRTPSSKTVIQVVMKTSELANQISPETVYLNKPVQVTGKVTLHENGLQMMLQESNVLPIKIR